MASKDCHYNVLCSARAGKLSRLRNGLALLDSIVMMIKDVRRFDAVDPFGRTWNVIFLWHQNGISIRHADTIDVKFQIHSGDEHLEKVIALNHIDLLKLSQATGQPLTDPWCMKLAALHINKMIETWDDMDKTLVTVPYRELEEHNAALQQPATVEE